MESLVYMDTFCYHAGKSSCHALCCQQCLSSDCAAASGSDNDSYYHFRHTSNIGDKDRLVCDVTTCVLRRLFKGMVFCSRRRFTG